LCGAIEGHFAGKTPFDCAQGCYKLFRFAHRDTMDGEGRGFRNRFFHLPLVLWSRVSPQLYRLVSGVRFAARCFGSQPGHCPQQNIEQAETDNHELGYRTDASELRPEALLCTQ
jgi:hypothetical protein